MRELETISEDLMMIDINEDTETILAGYLISLKGQFVEVREAIEAQDKEKLGKLAHKIYGTAESYGLSVVGKIFKDIHYFYDELGSTGLINLIEQLSDYLNRVEDVLKARLQQ